MKAIGELQRLGSIRRGLYKEFILILEDVETNKESSGESEEVDQPIGDSTMSEETTDNVVNLNEVKLDDREESRIKERMAKEHEKLRQRLLNQEAKLRERARSRAEKKAQRSGMQLEQLQEIKEKKDEITAVTEQIKVLRDSKKALQEELKGLRPSRKKEEEQKAAS